MTYLPYITDTLFMLGFFAMFVLLALGQVIVLKPESIKITETQQQRYFELAKRATFGFGVTSIILKIAIYG